MKPIRPRPASGLPPVVLVVCVALAATSLRHRGDAAAQARDRRPAALAQALRHHIHLPMALSKADGAWPMPPPPPTAAPPTATAIPSATTATPESPSPSPPPAGTAIPSDFAPFGLVRLAPERRLAGSGLTVDSLAFWEAPDPADTLLLVTAKGNGRVEVWRAPFDGPEATALQHPGFQPGARVNGVAVDPAGMRAYVTVSRPASTIAVFALPGLEPAGELVAGRLDLGVEPNLALMTLADGARRLFVSADDRVHVLDPDTDADLGGFRTPHALEAMWADDLAQILYIPDETGRSGVYAYHPDGRPFERGGATRLGAEGVFQADAEGIAAYACRGADGRDDGRGWLIVADQRVEATDLELFDRRSWRHLGRLQMEGVAATDGVASTRQPLPGHPDGLLAAVHDDSDVALIGWDRVRAATGLDCGDRAPASRSLYIDAGDAP